MAAEESPHSQKQTRKSRAFHTSLRPGDTPQTIRANGGRRRSSICHSGTRLWRQTTRSALNSSTTGLLDPVLNDNPLAVEAHQVLAARRFVDPRRPTMRAQLGYHMQSSTQHIGGDVNRSRRRNLFHKRVNTRCEVRLSRDEVTYGRKRQWRKWCWRKQHTFQSAGLGNFCRGLISSLGSRPRRKSKAQPWCA